MAKEIVEDYGLLIDQGLKKALEINKQIPKDDDKQPRVTWRDVLNLDAPAGLTRQEKVQEQPDMNDDTGASKDKKSGKPK
jgi:hypothetical protein